jgi:hypothetical protein
MDTSKNTIVVGILNPGEEVPVLDRIWNEEGAVRHLIGRLGEVSALRVCYEQPMRAFVKWCLSGAGRGWLARWRDAAGLGLLRWRAVAGWGAVAWSSGST